jgi:hypothetical protein
MLPGFLLPACIYPILMLTNIYLQLSHLSHLCLRYVRFPVCVKRLLDAELPGFLLVEKLESLDRLASARSLKGQERKMPADYRPRLEVYPRETACPFCIIEVGKREIWSDEGLVTTLLIV